MGCCTSMPAAAQSGKRVPERGNIAAIAVVVPDVLLGHGEIIGEEHDGAIVSSYSKKERAIVSPSSEKKPVLLDDLRSCSGRGLGQGHSADVMEQEKTSKGGLMSWPDNKEKPVLCKEPETTFGRDEHLLTEPESAHAKQRCTEEYLQSVRESIDREKAKLQKICASARSGVNHSEFELMMDSWSDVPYDKKYPGSTWFKLHGSSLEPLLVHTTLVDLEWLDRFLDQKEMPELQGIVPAWQQLPKEAECKLDSLRASRLQFEEERLPLIILSYGWGSKEHPDPTGAQLQRVKQLLSLLAEDPQMAQSSDKGSKRPGYGVLMDFLALPQRGRTGAYDPEQDDRTPYQRARFELGLGSINEWYGHKYTTTLVINTPIPCNVSNQCPIDRRGWCIFEKRISTLTKNRNCYWQLASFDPKEHTTVALAMDACAGLPTYDADANFDSQRGKWIRAGGFADKNLRRPVPINPDQFERMLREGVELNRSNPELGVQFTSGKDLTEVVLPQYRKCFERLMAQPHNLEYAALSWEDDEVAHLCESILWMHQEGMPSQASVLDLAENGITDDGAVTLARTLRAGRQALPKLRQVKISHNKINFEALCELAAAVHSLHEEGKRPVKDVCDHSPLDFAVATSCSLECHNNPGHHHMNHITDPTTRRFEDEKDWREDYEKVKVGPWKVVVESLFNLDEMSSDDDDALSANFEVSDMTYMTSRTLGRGGSRKTRAKRNR